MSARVFRRLILMPLGLVAAAVVATLVVVNVGFERMGDVGGFGGVRLGWRLAGELNQARSWGALAPALVVVVVAEFWRARSVVFYLGGGALALVLAPVVMRLAQAGTLAIPEHEVARVLAVAGMAGGYVYWYLAGHDA